MKRWNEAENPYHRPGLLNLVKHERATNRVFETCDTAGSVQAILMTPLFILSLLAPRGEGRAVSQPWWLGQRDSGRLEGDPELELPERGSDVFPIDSLQPVLWSA